MLMRKEEDEEDKEEEEAGEYGKEEDLVRVRRRIRERAS